VTDIYIKNCGRRARRTIRSKEWLIVYFEVLYALAHTKIPKGKKELAVPTFEDTVETCVFTLKRYKLNPVQIVCSPTTGTSRFEGHHPSEAVAKRCIRHLQRIICRPTGRKNGKQNIYVANSR
jgi:hypothetical protein